jgi:hypothetical protein
LVAHDEEYVLCSILGLPWHARLPYRTTGLFLAFAGGTLARQKLRAEIDPCQNSHGRLHLRQSKRRNDPSNDRCQILNPKSRPRLYLQ